MGMLVSASFVAAFLAGVAALFAPCCITVLLPSYFASVFKTKSKVFLMTFIYFLGLLAIFIPVGLGFSALTQAFRTYHNAIFVGGGIFLTILGAMLAVGYKFSFPMPLHPQLKKYDAISVFGLGIFSAIATTCCAPVLAGVLALSALPGSVFLGTMYTITYVLGMVTPLFLIAALLDRTGFSQKVIVLRKPITLYLFGLTMKNTVSNLVSGLMFLGIGITTLYLSASNRISMQGGYQLAVNLLVADLTKRIGNYAHVLPEPVWAVIFAVAVLAIIGIAINQFREKDQDKEVKK